LNEFLKDDITEGGDGSGDGSVGLGVSTNNASTGESVDWSGKDLLHDVGWDSFLVAFSINNPVSEVLRLVKFLEES